MAPIISDEHGPGLHHLKFSVPTHEPSMSYLKDKGIEIEQMGAPWARIPAKNGCSMTRRT